MNEHSTTSGLSTNHVVILIHGIRDFALWQESVRKALSGDFVVESTNYGRFDLFRFLLPSEFFRKQVADKVWEQIRDIRKQYPNAKYSFIAHSFGTYVLARILSRHFDFQAHRIILCGSVLRYDFPFEQISDRFVAPIVNEVGARDVWPAIAESVTMGYGSAGTYGFRRSRVRDRWHAGAGHGYFLTPEFCKTFWIPYLRDGILIEGEAKPESPSIWVRFISTIRIKYLLLLSMGLVVWLLAAATWQTKTPNTPDWQTHSRWCTTDAGSSGQAFRAACGRSDAYSAVISCQSEPTQKAAQTEVGNAGRVAVNQFMLSIGYKCNETSAGKDPVSMVEQRSKLFIDTAAHFEAYEISWSQLIEIAKRERSLGNLPDVERQLKTRYVNERDAAKKLWRADLKASQLYFAESVQARVDEYIRFDSAQNVKQLDELPPISDWQKHHSAILQAMREEIQKK